MRDEILLGIAYIVQALLIGGLVGYIVYILQ
jgi:hypothetical protein